jgi:hypothetical protein
MACRIRCRTAGCRNLGNRATCVRTRGCTLCDGPANTLVARIITNTRPSGVTSYPPTLPPRGVVVTRFALCTGAADFRSAIADSLYASESHRDQSDSRLDGGNKIRVIAHGQLYSTSNCNGQRWLTDHVQAGSQLPIADYSRKSNLRSQHSCLNCSNVLRLWVRASLPEIG